VALRGVGLHEESILKGKKAFNGLRTLINRLE
jgi:hypothetical protein